MRKLQDILADQGSMSTIVQLTGVFEAIASTHIAEVKDQVLQAQDFFNELWKIYSQIRVDKLFRFGRQRDEVTNDKELYIIVTSAGGFSGDIDQRLIKEMLDSFKAESNDIIVIGYHGAQLLAQSQVTYKKYFKIPANSRNLNVEPLIKEIRQYKSTVIFYQSYVSLMTQDIKKIEATAALKELSQNNPKGEEIISEETYIFEPSSFDVIMHLERSMLQIMLGQVIFESQLAQYASRFRAMTLANNRSVESLDEVKALYNRTRRERRDTQLKMIINDMRILNKGVR